MRHTEINYKVGNKVYKDVVQERKGWESHYLQNVLNRIESITDSETADGKHPVIVSIYQHN